MGIGKLTNGSGYVKFGKLIVPEMTFRSEEEYPYLIAAATYVEPSETERLHLIMAHEYMEEIITDSKGKFTLPGTGRSHVMFLEEISEELKEGIISNLGVESFVVDKWLPTEIELDSGNSAAKYGFNSFDFDVKNTEGAIMREKDSITSLEGMEFITLFPQGDEGDESELYMKAGEYITPPTEGVILYASATNEEISYPTESCQVHTLGNGAWEIYKDGEMIIFGVIDPADFERMGVEEAGTYANILECLVGDPLSLIRKSQQTDYLIKSNTISNIADSIRDKLGTSAKMLLEDMPNAIKSIATVGDSITITWDGQPTETVFDSKYYKVSDLYFNGAQLINATVTLTNGTEEVTGKYTDKRWNKLGLKTGDKGVAWGLELMLFSTDGTNMDLEASKGTYIGVLASGDYSGYWVSSITYPVTPNVTFQEKTITANGTYLADEGYDGISKVTVNVPTSSGSSSASEDTIIFEWDGQPTDTVIDLNGDGSYLLCLVSDEIITPDDINELIFENNLSIETGVSFDSQEDFFHLYQGMLETMIVVTSDVDIELGDVIFHFKAGIYLPYGEDIYITKCTRLSAVSIERRKIDNIISRNLENIESDVVEVGRYAFTDCLSLKTASFPKCESIKYRAFYNTSLENFDFPVVETIDTDAFYSCKFVEIVLPETLKKIYSHPFNYCWDLTDVTFKGTPTDIDETSFSSCNSLIHIYVPWNYEEVANAPWGATIATIYYNWKSDSKLLNYSGKIFPNVKTVGETFKYHIIGKAKGTIDEQNVDGIYYCLTGIQPLYLTSSGSITQSVDSSEENVVHRQYYRTNEHDWYYYSTDTFTNTPLIKLTDGATTPYNLSNFEIIWADHDIKYEDGTLYLAGSEATVVHE